jgi:hypothetical protein
MHASAADAKGRRLNAELAVDMITTESFLGCHSAIRDAQSNSDISGADIVTHSTPSGSDTGKRLGRQFAADKRGIWIQI